MNLFLIFQYGLVGTFVVLLGTFLLAMTSESVEGCVSQLFGLHTKNKTLQFLGIGMGGVLLALQAMMSYRRAKALEDTVRNAEQGQRQERLKNAIEHLGHESDSVRLGGAYELFHLVGDTKDIRRTVFDILCAHIRQTTGEEEYRKKYPSKPSEEIQSLLTLLFVQKREIFKGLRINLQGSWLNGANLQDAYLEKANLIRTHLWQAKLGKAYLQGARLAGAQLQGVWLVEARLQGAELAAGARLQGADLMEAQLQGAWLPGARLQGANLMEAQLQGAWLGQAQLQGAILGRTRLQGVTSQRPHFLSFKEDIRDRVGKGSDLTTVIFEGGLRQEDLDSLVAFLTNEEAMELRRRMRRHIDSPASHKVPEDSGAIIGAYTKEEAEQWIAEYNEAMSEVPGNNN